MAIHYLQTVLAIFGDAIFHRQLLSIKYIQRTRSSSHISSIIPTEIIETDFDQTLEEINTSL